MSHDERYQQWIRGRRSTRCGPELASRVMAVVEQAPDGVKAMPRSSLLAWLDRSPVRRAAACAAALLLGIMPFLYVYVAYVSQVSVF